MTEPLLVLDHVSRGFAGAPRAVDDVSLALPAGATLAVVGESGSGKSTLARLAAGLLRPQSGSVRFAAGRHRVAMVFQDPAGSLDPRWPVGASIAEPLRALGRRRDGHAARVAALLEQVGLPPAVAARRPDRFSLGQVQRIAIARALAGEPDFLVCDEPTSALDVSVQAQVLNLLRALQRRLGLTMLFISHDPGVVRFMADTVAVMQHGRIVEAGAAAEVFARPAHAVTRRLLAAA